MQRNLILCIIILICGFVVNAQNIQWAKNSELNSSNVGNSTAVDDYGNVYVIGSFYGDTISFGSQIFLGNGILDIYLVKYDPNGNVKWVKTVGGDKDDCGNSVAVDINNNVCITGNFKSDSIRFDKYMLYNTDDYNVFVVKYDPNGNILWAKAAVPGAAVTGTYIATDYSGNFFITGFYSTPQVTFGNITLNTNGDFDYYLTKFDSAGNVLWATSAGGISSDRGTAVAADMHGNIYALGYFTSDSVMFGKYKLINHKGIDLFVVKYDKNGKILWAKSNASYSAAEGYSICCDKQNNVYVTGYFSSPQLQFDNIILNNNGNNNGSLDIFLVRFDSSGKVIWAKNYGNSNFDVANSVFCDNLNNIYIAGYFTSNNISFDSVIVNSFGGYSIYNNIFIAKLDSNANVLWGYSAGAKGNSEAKSVVLDTHDNIYFTGAFLSPAITFGNTTLNNKGFSCVLTAKLSPTVDVKNIYKSNNILFSPNPAKDFINIKTNKKINYLEIKNLMGQTLFTIHPNESSIKINLNGYPKGIYFVKVQQLNKIETKKFIIE